MRTKQILLARANVAVASERDVRRCRLIQTKGDALSTFLSSVRVPLRPLQGQRASTIKESATMPTPCRKRDCLTALCDAPPSIEFLRAANLPSSHSTHDARTAQASHARERRNQPAVQTTDTNKFDETNRRLMPRRANHNAQPSPAPARKCGGGRRRQVAACAPKSRASTRLQVV